MKTGYKKIVFGLLLINILSKITGMLRESFIASAFGVSYKIDAYNIATLIPFIIFSLIGQALTTTFIPILSEIYEKKGKNEMYNFANTIINIIVIITVFLFILGEIFPQVFVSILAPGFNFETKGLAIALTRISMINILFIGLNYGFISVLNVLGEFSSTGITGTLLNLPIILYIILSKQHNVYLLMVYSMIGYGIQILAHIPYLIKNGYKYNLKINFKDYRIKKMLVLIIPILFGIGINQLNIIVDRIMASSLKEGTIAIIGYANKTNEISYTLIIGTIMTVVFPIISKSANKDDDLYAFKENIFKIQQGIIFIIVPITLIFAYLRKDVLTVLFKYGAFNEYALEETSMVLLCLSFSTIFYSLRDIYNRGLLALQDTKSSVINTSIGIAINILLNILTVSRFGVIGLATSTTISSIITAYLLKISLYKKINKKVSSVEVMSTIKIYFISILMILSLIIINYSMKNILLLKFNAFVNLVINGTIGIIVYIFFAYIFNCDELSEIFNEIKNKFKNI